MSSSLKPENWVKDHSDYLYSYAITRIFNKEDALDLIQETFFFALKAQDTFKGESAERTWLTAILKRKIIDYFRKRMTRSEQLLETLSGMDGRFQDNGPMKGHWKKELAPHTWIPEHNNLENEEFQGIFNKCLSYLPKTWAAVFTLKTIEEYSTEEVCKELGITSSNIWTTIHRAKLQLRDCLEKNWVEKRRQV